MADAPFDPDSLRVWMREHGYRAQALSQSLGVSVYTVNKWLRGVRPVRPIVTRALHDLGKRRLLSDGFAAMTVDGEAFETWRVDRGLTKRAVARGLPVTENRVLEWAKGERALSVVEARALRDLDRELRRSQPRPRA